MPIKIQNNYNRNNAKFLLLLTISVLKSFRFRRYFTICQLTAVLSIRHFGVWTFLFFENFLPSNPEKRPLFSLYFIEGLFSKDTHKNACSHSLLSRGKIFLQNRLTNAFALSIQVRGQIKNSKNQKISAVYLTKTPFPVGISGGLFQKKFADYLIFVLSLSIQARASFAS